MAATERWRRARLSIEAALASAYFAAMFFVVFPAAILYATREEPFAPGAPLAAVGGAALIAAANLFVIRLVATFVGEGDGTHVPLDPPRRMVRSRAYRSTRNPMYLAYVVTAGGEALLFGSAPLLVYAAALWAIAHLYVVLREEPLLERRFGEGYRSYCRDVPRWGLFALPAAALRTFGADGDPTVERDSTAPEA